jgi:hypothetical protein
MTSSFAICLLHATFWKKNKKNKRKKNKKEKKKFENKKKNYAGSKTLPASIKEEEIHLALL